MLTIKVWCLPEMSEDQLQGLFRDILSAVVGVKELGCKDEKDLLILFPPDKMRYGLGEDIIVEISRLIAEPYARNRLAKKVGQAVNKHFPFAYVECATEPFDPKIGFWASEKPKPIPLDTERRKLYVQPPVAAFERPSHLLVVLNEAGRPGLVPFLFSSDTDAYRIARSVVQELYNFCSSNWLDENRPGLEKQIMERVEEVRGKNG